MTTSPLYLFCKETHPATGIEHSIYCNFYDSKHRNLVTVGANQLTVYRLVTIAKDDCDDEEVDESELIRKLSDGTKPEDTKQEDQEEEGPGTNVRLECTHQFTLVGNVTSIGSVRLMNSPRDALVLCFLEAKLSVVEYDPGTHDLKTLSLHYFEEDEMRRGYTQPYPHAIPIVRVDPDGRCAAMLIYGRSIIILPFRKDVVQEAIEAEVASSILTPQTSVTSDPLKNAGLPTAQQQATRAPVLASYKLDLREEQYVEKINNILDIQFLHGYYEPTLLILHEPVRTWAGRIAVRQDTCSMVALSLNIADKVNPIIWSVNNLPYDCLRAIPVPKPIGGVLIAAVNELIYLNQSVPAYGVSLNGFTEGATTFPLKPQEGILMALDCSQSCFIAPDRLLISTKDGDIYAVTLFADGMRSIRSFAFEKAAASVITTCITKCEESYLFLGSRLGNSLLLYYKDVPEKAPKPIENGDASKPSIAAALDIPGLSNDDLINDLDAELYGSNGIKEEEPTDNAERGIKRSMENGVDKSPSSVDHDDEHKRLRSLGIDEDWRPDDPDEDPKEVDDVKQEAEEDGLEDKENSDQINEQIDEENDGDSSKDDLSKWMAGDVKNIETTDTVQKYERQVSIRSPKDADSGIDELEKRSSIEFELCDSILNIAPCGRICMGENAFLSDEFHDLRAPDVEIVTTSGWGKNGALSVLQRTIRPQVLTTYELPGITDIWGVYGPKSRELATTRNEDLENPEVSDSNKSYLHHEFMILSRSDSTMVLQAGQEINELENSGFTNQTSTVFAGNLLNNEYIFQVNPTGVRLLKGEEQLQHIPIDVGSPIVFTSLADPYAVLLTENGIVLFLMIEKQEEDEARLVVQRPANLTSKYQITALCLYKDISGIFTTEEQIPEPEAEEEQEEEAVLKSEIKMKTQKPDQTPAQQTQPLSSLPALASMAAELDDEDELLYGDSGLGAIPSSFPTESVKQEVDELEDTQDEIEPRKYKKKKQVIPEIVKKTPSYWLFIARENGLLEIYSMPQLQLSYLVKNFPNGPKVLVDSVQMTEYTGSGQQSSGQEQISSQASLIHEMLVIGLGAHKSRPHLFARLDSELLVYEAFPFHENPAKDHLKMRFRKFGSTFVFINELSKFQGQSFDEEIAEQMREQSRPKTCTWLKAFEEVCGYSGVFLGGPYPHWFVMTHRGALRVHEMRIDGPISCFAPFNNINCPQGFMYLNSKNMLRISVLPNHLTYDAPWAARRVALKCSPHFVCYHRESKTYCVVTSKLETYDKLVRVGGDEKDYEPLERESPRYIWPQTERFALELFSPLSWQAIAGTRIELDEWEHVTCLKNVYLHSEGTESGLKGYIALGTNYCYGEDVTSRGRIWILDIIDVVPEPGQPLTRSKIKIEYCKEQKGPVTALAQVKGLLLSAIGQKLFLWQLKENQLSGVAFIDTEIYIHSAISIKNIILVADVRKSICLLRYQEETRTLSLVARDPRDLEAYACEFLIDNNHLYFLVSDSDKNLLIYAHQPETIESFGGTRLLRRGDFHLGQQVNSMFRIKARIPSPWMLEGLGEEATRTINNKQLTVFGTLDGAVGYVLPVPEKIYRRLLMLQNLMSTSIQHYAGLNPRAYRQMKLPYKALMNPLRNILDGELLYKFLTLPQAERLELAKKIGTQPMQIFNDLLEIEKMTNYF